MNFEYLFFFFPSRTEVKIILFLFNDCIIFAVQWYTYCSHKSSIPYAMLCFLMLTLFFASFAVIAVNSTHIYFISPRYIYIYIELLVNKNKLYNVYVIIERNKIYLLLWALTFNLLPEDAVTKISLFLMWRGTNTILSVCVCGGVGGCLHVGSRSTLGQ